MFICKYPDITRALIINCGSAHPYCSENPWRYPKGRYAVFIASPGEPNFSTMEANKKLLDSLGYRTCWLEFTGGHRLAPMEINEKAADWLAQFI